MSPAGLAHYLGIVPRWVDNTSVGGTSYLIHVRHATAAIAAGLCNTVLVAMGASGRSRVAESTGRIGAVSAMASGRRDNSYPGQFESIYGTGGPTTAFGMGVLRYMKETGTTHEQNRFGGRGPTQVVQPGPSGDVWGPDHRGGPCLAAAWYVIRSTCSSAAW